MLKARILTALAMVTLFLGAIFYLPDSGWVGLMLLVIFIAAHEWSRMSGFTLILTWLFVVSTLALCFSLFWFIDYDSMQIAYFYFISAFFWAFVAPIWLSQGWKIERIIPKVVVGWVLLVPTWLAAIDLRVQGPYLFLAIMAVIWIADTAAYFSGRKFGRNKLAPSISPGKSWEGVWGALVAVSAYALLLRWFGAPFVPLYLLIPAFVLLTAFSIEGDLFESMMKRQAGLKDSGTILPGHGGILDRIDSLTSALPLAAFVLSISAYLS